MSGRTLKQILLRLYEPQTGTELHGSASLQARVMADYHKRFRRRHRVPWMPQARWARTAMAAVLVVAVLGVACELPTRATVDMGQRVVVQVQPSAATADLHGLEGRLHQALIDAGAEKVRITVAEANDQPCALEIIALDEKLSPADIEAVLTEEIGADNILTVDFRTLSGSFSETLGHRLARTFFGMDVSQDTAEELRASILQRLAEQGFDGSTQVDVQDDGSVRRITVEAGTTDGTRQIADEVVIERKDN